MNVPRKAFNVVHDLLMDRGYDSPSDRQVEMVYYIIPKRFKEQAEKDGWECCILSTKIYLWMLVHVQKGDYM